MHEPPRRSPLIPLARIASLVAIGDLVTKQVALLWVGSLEPPMLRSTAKIPGLGDVHWGQWIGALSDAGYDGPVCVEVEDEAPNFHGSLSGRKRALQISRNILQPLIA